MLHDGMLLSGQRQHREDDASGVIRGIKVADLKCAGGLVCSKAAAAAQRKQQPTGSCCFQRSQLLHGLITMCQQEMILLSDVYIVLACRQLETSTKIISRC
jgi:hypothetical protein